MLTLPVCREAGHSASRSETFVSVTHMTVSAPPKILTAPSGSATAPQVKTMLWTYSSYFPRIFRLQSPRGAHTDHLCRVLQVSDVVNQKTGLPALITSRHEPRSIAMAGLRSGRSSAFPHARLRQLNSVISGITCYMIHQPNPSSILGL
jgi:hypothetical protein